MAPPPSSTPPWRLVPPAPKTLEDTGLSPDLVTQLLLKTMHFSGDVSGTALADRLGLPWPVIEPVVEQLKGQHQIAVQGGSYLGAATFTYRITDAGRARAIFFLEASGYVGAAPVPLAQYAAYMQGFARAVPRSATPDSLRNAFEHLVLPDSVLDEIGPAINAGRSIFIYGPPGNGKTQVSYALRDVLASSIAIPHALEVEGQIIRVFDPVRHEPVDTTVRATTAEARQTSNLVKSDADPDGRWVRCWRPAVMAGGELTMESLMLGRAHGGTYKAPLQLVANGGVLVIDDFGRQRCSTTELLNRWIVPLESRVDFLTLATGQSFQVPFQVLVVFATNLRPQDLMDEAFLRRIHAKVRLRDPDRAEFTRIFAAYCEIADVPYDPALVDHLLDGYYRRHGTPMRGCHPRDLITHALLMAEYRGLPQALTPGLLDAACDVYFVRDDDALAQPAG